LTIKWLQDNVGKPSEKWGSKYTKIFEVTGEFERSSGVKQFQKGLELWRRLDEWSYSPHPGAKTPAQRQEKERQQKWLNVFERELKDYLWKEFQGDEALKHKMQAHQTRDPKYQQKDAVRVILYEMKNTKSIPLLMHTGTHLAENVETMVFDPNSRGHFQIDNKLSMNPAVLHNKSEAMGTLVHECHHKLNPMPGKFTKITNQWKYIDEFVAHWKEHEITRPSDLSRADWVNDKLKAYGNAVRAWEEKYHLLNDIKQTGVYAVPDNHKRRTESPDLDALEGIKKR
jgi:hypothetical protein